MDPRLRALDEQEAERFLKGVGPAKVKWLLDQYADDITYELREDEVLLARYLKMRSEGGEHVWALMAACRKAAGSKGSDRAFEEHARQRMASMSKMEQDLCLKEAEKAGINTHGRYHMSGLGPPSDPQAWVSDTHDVLKVCKERNYTCSGHVNYKGVEVPPVNPGLAPDLVDEMVAAECQENPALAQKVRQSPKHLSNLRHLVREKYGPSRKRG